MREEELLDWVALNLIEGLGPIFHKRALERFGDPGAIAHRIPVHALASIPGRTPKALADLGDARRSLRRRAERERRRAERAGVRLIPRAHPAYPAELTELPDAPILLYQHGELPVPAVRVAVVGSRAATMYGKRIATGLACGLAARGIEVVSGGARGIDTCAHRGALEENGRTIAVLGCGFDHTYPPENRDLFEKIADAGTLVSELPMGTPPKAENFPRRNRLISALSVAVVVVEANLRSGSLSTANHAAEQGREVLAVPGPVTSERSWGCHKLIQDGAKLIQNVDDILQELSPMYVQAVPGKSPAAACHTDPAPLKPDEEAVLKLLDAVEPAQVNELADRAPFGFARLQAALFGLEVAGAIESLPGGHFRLKGRYFG